MGPCYRYYNADLWRWSPAGAAKWQPLFSAGQWPGRGGHQMLMIPSYFYPNPKNKPTKNYMFIIGKLLKARALYSSMLHSTPLHSTPLYSTPLYSTLLHSTLLHSTPLHLTPLYSTPFPSNPI